MPEPPPPVIGGTSILLRAARALSSAALAAVAACSFKRDSMSLRSSEVKVLRGERSVIVGGGVDGILGVVRSSAAGLLLFDAALLRASSMLWIREDTSSRDAVADGIRVLTGGTVLVDRGVTVVPSEGTRERLELGDRRGLLAEPPRLEPVLGEKRFLIASDDGRFLLRLRLDALDGV